MGGWTVTNPPGSVSAHSSGRLSAGARARARCLAAAGLAALLISGYSRADADSSFTIRPASGARPAEVGVGAVRLWPWNATPDGAALHVLDAAGGAVGFEVVEWLTDGPLDLLFDCRAGASNYTVRIAPAATAPVEPTWRATAGLVLETRALPPSPGAVDTLAQALELWRVGRPKFGRSRVDAINQGVHPHGPHVPLMARYEGWLDIPRDGRYGFATLSDDASFLLIDGRPVAAWPGWHGLDGSGLRGEYQGFVELRRGPHRITYHNCQNDGGFHVAAAWQPPGVDRFAIIPPTAYRAPAPFEAVAAVGGPEAPAAFSWEIVEHAAAGASELIGVRLWALPAAAGDTCRWRFDDGSTATGTEVVHVYTVGGQHEVRLEVVRDGRARGTLTRQVAIHRQWQQASEFPEAAYVRLCGALRQTGFDRLPAADLARLVVLADQIEDRDLLAELAGICRARRSEFGGVAAEGLLRLGFFAQHPTQRQYGWVPEFWQAALAAPGVPAPTAARVRLHLAGFLIHSGQDLAAAGRLLDELAAATLDETDGRLRLIYLADIQVMRCEREAAAVLYRQAGTVVAPDDTTYQVRRLARLENARVYLRQKDYDAAERVAREIEWERPLERLELETGLILVAAFRGRGEAPFARTACLRLLQAAPDDPQRAELLRVTAEVCQEQGAGSESRQALEELNRSYPYSEAAAVARDRFGSAAEPGNGKGSR